MRILYIAANLKMNTVKNQGDLPEKQYAEHIRNALSEIGDMAIEVSVFCPYTHLSLMADMADAYFNVGAQNMHALDCGAYTGDISADLLLDIGINHVLLGHSEVRQYHAETDTLIGQKLQQAMKKGLYAVLCIGESDAENQAGDTQSVLQQQIRKAIADTMSADRIVIAYEPVWAIGTGRVPSTQDIAHTHTQLRAYLQRTYGMEFGDSVRILYGGSVNGNNASDILKLDNVDGVLVGVPVCMHKIFVTS